MKRKLTIFKRKLLFLLGLPSPEPDEDCYLTVERFLSRTVTEYVTPCVSLSILTSAPSSPSRTVILLTGLRLETPRTSVPERELTNPFRSMSTLVCTHGSSVEKRKKNVKEDSSAGTDHPLPDRRNLRSFLHVNTHR